MLEQFSYKTPKSLEEAFALIQQETGKYALYAGGTDILVKMRAERLHAEYIIDIKRIPELQGIKETPTEIRIGAAVTLSEIEQSDVIKKWYPSLCDAVSAIGSVPIRNKATLAGNIQNASPAGDGLIGAFAVDANLEVASERGVRRICLDGYFAGPGKTQLLSDEIITAIVLRKKKWTHQYFFKVGRRNALAISVVNGAVLMEADKDGTILDSRIVLGAVAPTPIRIRQAEQMLYGKKLDTALAEKIGVCVSEAVNPITDIRASAEYRRYIAGIQVKRQLQSAVR